MTPGLDRLLTRIDQAELIILRLTTLILLMSVCTFVIMSHLEPYFDEVNGKTEAVAEEHSRNRKPMVKQLEPRRVRRRRRAAVQRRPPMHRARDGRGRKSG